MQKISMDKILSGYSLFKKNKLLKKTRPLISEILEKVCKISSINTFIKNNSKLSATEFIDKVFEDLNIKYSCTDPDTEKIPEKGRLIIVANHPLGAIDGLALAQTVLRIRPDVKIVANNLLMSIKPLQSLFIPCDVFSGAGAKATVSGIEQALNREEAVIFFPSAEVSRCTLFKKIRDSRWQNGPVHFAARNEAPVLPVFIEARNSLLFYTVSALYKPMGMLLLSREMFSLHKRPFRIFTGDLISSSSFRKSGLRNDELSRLLRKHTLSLNSRKKKLCFDTYEAICRPVSTDTLIEEFKMCRVLRDFDSKKTVYLLKNSVCKNIINEIGRLREITFRKVGEGTGQKRDLDPFDQYYRHIVLWDHEKKQIAGAYRLKECRNYREGNNSIYTETLFDYREDSYEMLSDSVELGRSFVHPEYWKSNALDCLWQGVGTFISKYGPFRFLIGAVSMSGNFPAEAKNLIYVYYSKWFKDKDIEIKAFNRFSITAQETKRILKDILNTSDPDHDFLCLKERLKNLGHSVPVLFRHYSKLCTSEGMTIFDFCVDESFNSVDALIKIDIDSITESKKRRYHIESNYTEKMKIAECA